MTTEPAPTPPTEEPPLVHCPGCDQDKPVTAFWVRRNNRYGHMAYCGRCTYLHNRGVRRLPPAHERRRRLPEQDRHTNFVRQWEQRNPEKARAQRAVRKAVMLGQLAKPTACSACHEVKLLHGHHTDYSRPLDVVWLSLGEGRPTVWLHARLPYLHPDTTNPRRAA